jgi:hypothetical protein
VLKKTVTYEDFNGETVTEDHFFHLSKAELVEIEMSHEGGLSEALTKIVAANDAKTIIAEFKNIILTAYGVKSADGRRFIKNQQLREEFESSEAYSTIFMELVTDTDAAINFINGVIPHDLAQEAVKIVNSEKTPLTAVPTNHPKAEPTIFLSKVDLAEMPADEWPQLADRIAKGEVKIVE